MISETVKKQEHSLFHLKCVKLLEEPEIRFAGMINYMGNLIAGGFKRGIKPLVDDSEKRKMYMEVVLRVSTRKDFDYNMGPVKYAASRREKVVMLSFPMGNKVLLVSADPEVDIDKTAKKIMKISSSYF